MAAVPPGAGDVPEPLVVAAETLIVSGLPPVGVAVQVTTFARPAPGRK
jgi:hypothetical protein